MNRIIGHRASQRGGNASGQTAIARSRRLASCPHYLCTIVFAALVFFVAGAAGAETRIEGDAGSIRLQARDASVQEVLTALGAAYELRFRSATPLTRTITGSYRGPLARVVARVLVGYDYVAKSANGKMEVDVLSAQQGQPEAPPASAIPGVGVSVTKGRTAPAPSPQSPATRVPGL